MHALIIGLLITVTTMALGSNTRGCFNPVRDLGPRLAGLAVGYPLSTFAAHSNWWIWGPWGACITGAMLGGFVYDFCIFKGCESPVNYTCRRWKIEGRMEKSKMLKKVGMHQEAAVVDRKIEEGRAGRPKAEVST